MNQIPIFLLALPQKLKYSKVSHMHSPADTASGNSLVVSAVSPLQPNGHPIQELPVVTVGNILGGTHCGIVYKVWNCEQSC